jgi:hypothetical protein
LARDDARHHDRRRGGAIVRAMLAAVCVPAALALALACGAGSSASVDQPNLPPSGPMVPIPANLWQPPAGSTPLTGSYAYLEMDAGFSPGASYPHTIVTPPGTFTVSATEGRLSVVAVDGAAGYAMNGVFQTMIGLTRLEEGYYADVRALSQSDPLRGAMSVALNSRSCDSPAGWFAIDHVFYFSGILTTLDMRFEARCTGFGAPMRGQIHWRE